MSVVSTSGQTKILGVSLSGFAMVSACVVIGLLIAPRISPANLAFLFLLPVVAMAGRSGLWAGIGTAAAATLAFNFFFVPPKLTLHVASLDNVVTMLMFTLTALAVSHVASRLKAQAVRAEQLATQSVRLDRLSLSFAQTRDASALRGLLLKELEAWSGSSLTCVTEDELSGSAMRLSPIDLSAAQWALGQNVPAGKGTAILSLADALFLPMRVAGEEPLLLQFKREDGRIPVSIDDLPLICQAVQRGTEALSRAHIAHAQAEIEGKQQQDAMREALLASISHDLRTPLTGIKAGLEALKPDKAGVLAETKAEAVRLERMVTNLLDLARLKSVSLPLTTEATDLTDVIDAALQAMRAPLAKHRVKVDLESGLPLILSDARLLHQILVNLLENAGKFSPDGTAISLIAQRSGEDIVLSIEDKGLGLPNPSDGNLFHSFKRGSNADRISGSGLGLAVVDGFSQVLGLGVSAENSSELGQTGAKFSLRFPQKLHVLEESHPDAA